jgi:hypothetical protein
MVNNKRSAVWKYFRRHQEKGVVSGICRFCGHTVTNNNATRMKGHLANNKLANVKFVKLYRRNFYIFPENEDIADVSIRDNVMMKLSQPERVGQTSFREGGFQFNEAEVEKAMAILLK